METENMYEIRVKNHISRSWQNWFEDMEINYQDEFVILQGTIPDQSALHGILMKIRDLGLTLISVNLVEKS